MVESSVVKLKNCLAGEYGYISEYIAVWKDKNTGFTVIQDPSSSQQYKNVVIKKSEIYNPLPTNEIPCMCNEKIVKQYPKTNDLYDCDVWGACILDLDFVKNHQQNSEKNAKIGKTLTAFGGIGLGVLFILTIFICMCEDCVYRRDYTDI